MAFKQPLIDALGVLHMFSDIKKQTRRRSCQSSENTQKYKTLQQQHTGAPWVWYKQRQVKHIYSTNSPFVVLFSKGTPNALIKNKTSLDVWNKRCLKNTGMILKWLLTLTVQLRVNSVNSPLFWQICRTLRCQKRAIIHQPCQTVPAETKTFSFLFLPFNKTCRRP